MAQAAAADLGEAHSALLHTARIMYGRMRSEAAARDDLEAAIASRDTAELKKALVRAGGIGLRGDEIRRAQAVLLENATRSKLENAVDSKVGVRGFGGGGRGRGECSSLFGLE